MTEPASKPIDAPGKWKWGHAGPGAERADYDHKARPADNTIVRRCRSCGGAVEKVAR